LPGQRDDEQRQRNAQQRMQREARRFEYGRGKAEVDGRDVDTVLRQQHRDANHQDAHHRKA